MFPVKNEPEKITSGTNAAVKTCLGTKLMNGLRDFADKVGATPFVVSMMAFAYVISRYSGSRKFYLNIPNGVRFHGEKGLDKTIGLCSNFIIFPIDIDNKVSVCENILAAQEQMFDIQEHIFYPGADAVSDVSKKLGTALPAPVVFTDLLSFSGEKDGDFEIHDWRIHTNQVMLEADLVRIGAEPHLVINYLSELFDSKLVENISAMFVSTLRMLCISDKAGDIRSVPLTGNDIEITERFNDTVSPVCEKRLNEILEENFEKYSERTAVICGGHEYTYLHIRKMADILRTAFRDAVPSDGSFIAAIFLPKSEMQIISAAAVLLSGGAYMPLDTELPQSQTEHCIRNVSPNIVITEDEFVPIFSFMDSAKIITIDSLDMSAKCGRIENVCSGDGESTRIIINTSGSTGYPKSIKLKESSIVNCLSDTVKVFGINDGARTIAVTNFSHDMAIFDTLGIFFFGGATVIPERKNIKEPSHWLELIKKHGVTIWNSVPSVLEMLMLYIEGEGGNDSVKLDKVISGGEFLRPSAAQRIKKMFDVTSLYNVGGPTETTIWNIFHEVTDKDIINELIPYGRPFPNTQYYILNEDMEICPTQVTGTMFCGGNCVSNGYIGLNEENENRFVSFRGERVYNTGDLGYMSENGEIIIVGRKDHQIKIRGKRIELSAISSALCEIEGVKNAEVIYLSDAGKIAAFYLASDGITEKEIVSYLKKRLADYMIPKLYFKVDSIPVISNGKPDRKLMEKTAEKALNKKVSIGSSKTNSSLKDSILEIVRSELDDDTVDGSMNFYMVGGDSLSAVKISAKINSRWGVRISVYDIINYADINEWLDNVCDIIRSASANRT